MSPRIPALIAALAWMLVPSCARDTPSLSGPSAGAASEPRVTVVNTVCPIAGDDFDRHDLPRSLTRTWKATAIGFCCEACPPQFDAMTDADKDRALAAALANKPGTALCPDEPTAAPAKGN